MANGHGPISGARSEAQTYPWSSAQGGRLKYTPTAAARLYASASRHLRPHLVHQREHLADVVVEEVADQQVGQVALAVRVLADECAEAEPIVVLAHQPPHPVHSPLKSGPHLPSCAAETSPFASPSAMASAAIAPRCQRQQHAGRVERVEEPVRVADQHPAVAGALLRAVTVILRGVVAGRSACPCSRAASPPGSSPPPRCRSPRGPGCRRTARRRLARCRR